MLASLVKLCQQPTYPRLEATANHHLKIKSGFQAQIVSFGKTVASMHSKGRLSAITTGISLLNDLKALSTALMLMPNTFLEASPDVVAEDLKSRRMSAMRMVIGLRHKILKGVVEPSPMRLMG